MAIVKSLGFYPGGDKKPLVATLRAYFYRVRTDQEILEEATAVTQVRNKGCLDKTGMGGGGVMEKDFRMYFGGRDNGIC